MSQTPIEITPRARAAMRRHLADYGIAARPASFVDAMIRLYLSLNDDPRRNREPEEDTRDDGPRPDAQPDARARRARG